MRFFLNRGIVVRLLISLAGGLILPLVLLWLLSAVAEKLLDAGYERAVFSGAIAFFWPLQVAIRIFPPLPHCQSCGPTDAALITAIIIYFVFYAVVTYIIQILVARLWNRFRNPSQTRSLSESRA